MDDPMMIARVILWTVASTWSEEVSSSPEKSFISMRHLSSHDAKGSRDAMLTEPALNRPAVLRPTELTARSRFPSRGTTSVIGRPEPFFRAAIASMPEAFFSITISWGFQSLA